MKFATKIAVIFVCLAICVMAVVFIPVDRAKEPARPPDASRVINDQAPHRIWLRV